MVQVWSVLRRADRGRVERGQQAVHLGVRPDRSACGDGRLRRRGHVHEQFVRHVREPLQAKHGERARALLHWTPGCFTYSTGRYSMLCCFLSDTSTAMPLYSIDPTFLSTNTASSTSQVLVNCFLVSFRFLRVCHATATRTYCLLGAALELVFRSRRQDGQADKLTIPT